MLRNVLAVTAGAQVNLSQWQFVRTDMANVWEVERPVKEGKPESVPLWQDVTLPHCYNAEDGVDPDVNYYQGAAWYRTTIEVANPYAGGHTLLEFEGAGQKTQVYVDGRLMGSHVGGYDRWTVDITEAGNGRHPIAVRCDNSRDVEMIPSDMSDFCLYGGLYRPVHLLYLPERYISDVRIDVEGDRVSVKTSPSDIGDVNCCIMSPDGKAVYEGGIGQPIRIRKPALWDVDSPSLYTLRITCGEQVVERRFGFRSYEFREHGPFFLNGRRLLLKGTHRHEDHAGVGAAMTDVQIRQEMQQIKDMGANFIRLGHYQQRDLVLDLCDSLGILVWEEIPWCRGGVGGEEYQQQAHRMLENMITQHRHHPSIILWGLGNENDWPGDFSTIIDTLGIRSLMTSLNDQAHRLDSQRKTVIRRCDFCADIVDIYSPSIWAGWYSRRFTDYCEMEEAAIESYIVRLFDWHLKEQARMPNLTGSAFWTFKDFCTPLRPLNPIPYVNQKGVVQRDGTPKESYYVFQSYWASQPMLHIYGHSWPVRWGEEGEPREVLVYSNQPEVELFVNGQSVGKRKRNIEDYPAQGFHWSVVLQRGTNTIKAVAKDLSDEITFEYQTAHWGKPAEVRLTRIAPDLIEAQLYDANGIRCLDSSDWIEFSIAGDGELLVNQGTATGSRRIQAANGRATIRLRSLTGPCVVGARCDGLPSALIHL